MLRRIGTCTKYRRTVRAANRTVMRTQTELQFGFIVEFYGGHSPKWSKLNPFTMNWTINVERKIVCFWTFFDVESRKLKAIVVQLITHATFYQQLSCSRQIGQSLSRTSAQYTYGVRTSHTVRTECTQLKSRSAIYGHFLCYSYHKEAS